MTVQYFPLADGIGKVQLMDHMGSDDTVVNAARVSMHKEASAYTVKQNDKLIQYLAKHKHWTPFSHPQVTLRIKMPIFIARQWFKHMVGFTRNEVSRRYVDDTPEFYLPTEWRRRAANVKQGSSDEVWMLSGKWLPRSYREALNDYEYMLEEGICPEQARMVLPQSMYTEFIETGSLAAYARLANLRLDPHAQKEIQWYAEAIDALMADLYPVSWEALKGNA